MHAPNEIVNCLRHLKKVGEAVFGHTEQMIRSGNWYGNDTIWRTVIDLNKVLSYANLDGTLNRHKTRRYFSLVDGIIAGEGNGPMAPDKKKVGLMIAGMSPVAVDCVCSKLMGFDYRKIPMLYKAFSIGNFPLVDFQYEDIESISNDEKFHGPLVELDHKDMFSFRPPFGWEGHVELEAK